MEAGSNVGIIYGLEFQCRSLCPVAADTETISFLVGTQGLKVPNQVHMVQLAEDSWTLSKRVYNHPMGEVWEISASHADPRLFATRHSQIDGQKSGGLIPGGSVWRIPSNPKGDRFQGGASDLELVCHFSSKVNNDGDKNASSNSNEVEHISWLPSSESWNKVMVLSNNRILLHDVNVLQGVDDERCSTIIASGKLDGRHGHDRLTTGAWNPHQNCQQFATANEHQVRGWDVRTMTQSWNLDSPTHCGLVRCIDFNPNKQYMLATSGDDGAVRFWDIRNGKLPVALRADHSHWVWSVKYNQFHDQLILTSSSDGRVVLSSMASISSEPHGHMDDDDDANVAPTKPLADGVIQVFDDHEDSVYVVEWSSADPWTFASLSYDGRLVINHVPKDVKFKILNLV